MSLEFLDEVDDVFDDGFDVNWSRSDAFLVGGADGEVGSGSRETKAKSPTTLVDSCSTFVSAFVHLSFTSTGLEALLVLVRASLSHAGLEFFMGAGGEGDENEENNGDFHWRLIIIMLPGRNGHKFSKNKSLLRHRAVIQN